MKHDFCRFLRREACSVVGGLFAVQCRAEGRWMVPKLGIKGGERWAAAVSSTNFPRLKEVKARSESSSAHVTNPLLHMSQILLCTCHHSSSARVTNPPLHMSQILLCTCHKSYSAHVTNPTLHVLQIVTAVKHLYYQGVFRSNVNSGVERF